MAAALDSTPYMVDYFSQLFGRYPFWKEKYGHCLAPLLGGMEHQTMTTLGVNLPAVLIAHELGHQWWGDNVTYSSWRDIWLSEGWASYCEQLFVEHFQGTAAAKTYRSTVFNRVMVQPGGSVIVDDTSDVYRIFDSRLTYDKGAAVAHMLRYIAPGDSVFFAGLKDYQQRFRYGLANTDSFRKVMEAAYGRSLDTFFSQWVYGQGYPAYSGSWNQKGSDVYIELRQTTSAPASVADFAMPVELKLNSSSGDTTIRVYLDRAQQLYHLSWAQPMSGFSIDPDDNIVNGTGSITNDPALAVSSQQAHGISIMPNPSSSGSWQLRGLRAGSTLLLYDMSGRLVWRSDNTSGDAAIDNRQLPAGIYALKVQQPGVPEAGFVLEKR
jgi:aminopeptidase N